MADKKKSKKRDEKPGKNPLRGLRENRASREKLSARLEKERGVLSDLLVAGAAAGIPVSQLATEAGISRIHAHRLLHDRRVAGEAAPAAGPDDGAPA